MVVAAIVVLLIRRALPQRGVLIRLFALLGGLTLVGIISTSRIFGDFFEYIIRWWWMIIAWIFAACVMAIAQLRRERWVGVSALGRRSAGVWPGHRTGSR